MRASAHSPPPLAAADLPVNPATLYPDDDGFFGRRARKRARGKLLAGIGDGGLRRALAPGETLRYVARGVRYALVRARVRRRGGRCSTTT